MTRMAAPEQEEFLRRFESELRADRDRRVAAVDSEGLTWLAVTPFWTDRLADRLTFPTGNRTLQGFLDAAAGVGLCATTTSAGDEARESIAARAIAALAPYVVEPFVAQDMVGVVLRAVADAPEERVRTQALLDLAPALGPSLVESAMKAARALKSDRDGARVLAALVAQVPDSGRPKIAAEAIAKAPTDEPYVLADVAATAAAPLPIPARSALVIQGLEAAVSIPDQSDRARVLTRLARVAPDDLADRVAAAADTIHDPGVRASVLASSSRVLPGTAALMARSVGAEVVTTDATARTMELSSAANTLALLGDVGTARRTAERIESASARARALASIAAVAASTGDARSIGDEVAGLASDAVDASDDPRTKITVETGLAGVLAGAGDIEAATRLLKSARDASIGLGQSIEDVKPLVELSRALRAIGDVSDATEVAERAWKISRAIGDGRRRIVAIASVIPELDGKSRATAVQEGVQTVRTTTDPVERASLLAMILPLVERGTLIDEILGTIDLAMEKSGGITFWMPKSVRRDVLRSIRSGSTGGDLRTVTSRIGKDIHKLHDDGVAIPDALYGWAKFARQVSSSRGVVDAGRSLLSEVETALACDDISRAVAIVNAGDALANVVGNPLEAQVRLANRRVTLYYRRTQDRRHLASFLRRREQIDAVERLLTDGDVWALHFLGMGGVGKTMLLRHVTAEFAPDHDLATARVDFDYLSPDYPVRRPGQLVLELLAELETYAPSSSAEEIVRQIEDAIVRLHESLATTTRPADQLASIRGQEFSKILDLFGQFLDLLGRRVVLILDTCEELAKVQPVGTTIPSVEATFDIIERMHDRSPDLRVVFAGRRLLALSGNGWRAMDADASAARSLLPASKPYVRLHEIRGFTEPEARDYLKRIKQLVLNEFDGVCRPGCEPGRRHGRIHRVASAAGADPRTAIQPVRHVAACRVGSRGRIRGHRADQVGEQGHLRRAPDPGPDRDRRPSCRGCPRPHPGRDPVTPLRPVNAPSSLSRARSTIRRRIS